MVKLYTYTDKLTEDNRRLVFPLLLDLWYLKNPELLNEYQIVKKTEDATVFVLPLQYAHLLNVEPDFVNEFIESAKKLNKKVWIYTAGDYGCTINDDAVVTFRLGGFHSKLPNQTVILPSLINDPYKNGILKEFSTLKWQEQPSIGFVGHAHISVVKLLKELYNHFKHLLKTLLNKTLDDYQSFYPSSIIRNSILNKIKKSSFLKANFIKRKNYRAGARTQEDIKMSTVEFFENINNNPYTLCIRGVGNFSVRLYETLAVGRIPILINTDCRLPLHDNIDWSKHCLIINDIKNLEQATLEFHNKFNDASFQELQKSNREFWLNLLSRESFFKAMAKSI